MARLTRKNIKVFAGSASNNGIFGSLQANNPTTTNDVEQLQSLSAWAEGWNAATETSEELPPLEEIQGVEYVTTYQQAYIMQEGMPEWAATVTYYKGSLVKEVTTNGFRIYNSLKDNNTNNLLSDTTNWKKVMDSDDLYAFDSAVVHLTGNENIAGIKTFLSSPIVPTASSGDNSTKAASTAYVDGGLSGKQATITGAATTITGSNLTASRALVSNSSGKVAVSNTTSTELGYVHGVTSAIQTQINAKAADNAVVKLTGNQTIAGTKTFSSTIAGSINGNAATVTNGVYTTGNQTIGGTKTFSSSPLVPTASSSDNSTKAASTAFVKAQGYVPASSFEEVAVVVESYQGTSDWYRVWSDGWIEQGGKSSSRSWTYPKPFSSATSYTIISNNSAFTDGYGRPDIIDCTATGATADINAVAPILWIAMGK